MAEQNVKPVESILEKIENMPVLSPSAVQLLQTLGDPSHSLAEIVKIVECDAELTAHFLKRVNSVNYGLVTEVTSVSRAVTYLGERFVVGIAVAACSSQAFDRGFAGFENEKTAFWEHSLKTAIASREVALVAGSETSPDVAFTAGLLHDIGKSVIFEFMVGAGCPIFEKVDGFDMGECLEKERELAGMNHCEAGRALAEQWKLPEILVPPITHHHHPGAAREEDRTLVLAVHLGDLIAAKAGSGIEYELHPEYSSYVNITEKEMGKILLNVTIEFSKTMRMFS
ncbi:MAG: HDOD domain-containing protein [Planctomycetota bacterium]|jgi:putative nucleotidyltransferase with HDIG domain